MTDSINGMRVRGRTEELLRSNNWVIAVELLIVVALCFYNLFPFSVNTLLFLFASHSLWTRRLGWLNVGLNTPESWGRAILQGVLAATLIMLATNLLISPLAARLAGEPIDLSMFDYVRGNPSALLQWLACVWLFAAFGEEMVYRAYLMTRIADLVGRTRSGWVVALLVSSFIFGLPHNYEGLAGMINASVIGMLTGTLYLISKRNLWPAIICHGLIDSVFFVGVYLRPNAALLNQ